MAGFHVRPPAEIRNVPVNNGMVYGLAMGLHASVMEIIGEFHGEVWGERAAQQPAEVLGGIKLLAGDYVSINFGGGMGVLPGLGAPDWRMFGGVSVAPSFDPNMRDTDKDGIVDALDRCIREPEDLDGFQDEDGCPEVDNDADGLRDPCRCPLDPEDEDGYQDGDGCPDTDNDKDLIMDVATGAPTSLKPTMASKMKMVVPTRLRSWIQMAMDTTMMWIVVHTMLKTSMVRKMKMGVRIDGWSSKRTSSRSRKRSISSLERP